MIRAALDRIAVALPETRITNADLAQEHPDWDLDRLMERVGVGQRRIAAPNVTALDLGEQACRRLFEAEADSDVFEALVFCTQTPDYPLPSNACCLQGRLGLGESVLAFDLAMGCSGFVNGLTLADALIRAGTAQKVLLVTADTLSRKVHPGDRSTRPLFGDGAAATLLRASEGEAGILGTLSCTAGRFGDRIVVPAGGSRLPLSSETAAETVDARGNVRTSEHVFMDGMAVLGLVSGKVPVQIRALLARHGLATEDIDLFVFHQASKIALDSLERLLKIPADRHYRNLERVGNTVSASIPIALSQAIEEGKARPGDLILVSGFGVGLAWASALIRL